MYRQLTLQQRLQKNREYVKKLLSQKSSNTYPLSTKLASNPFLRHQDKFQFLIYQLNQYNKRLQKHQVSDPYEMLSYQRLYSMVSDMAQIETKQDQLKTLVEVYDWFRDQSRLVDQRKNQGEIRYEMNKEYRKYLASQQDKTKSQQIKDEEEMIQKAIDQIPSQLISRLMQPYYFGNRTSHKQLDVPLRRLNQYKRKVINIAPFIDSKQPMQPHRVLYPMPPKQQAKEEQQEPKQNGQENIQLNAQGQLVDAQAVQIVQNQEKKQEDNNQQAEQDLGGFGQEPQEPEEEQPPEDTEDKLAPKNKLFTAAVTNITSNYKTYNGQYMHYKGRQNASQRSLEMRYLKLQQKILSEQRQDKFHIQLAGQRARKKSKMVKDIQKKLEDIMQKPQFKFSVQQQGHQQKLSKQDQLRFGFTTNIRGKPKLSQIDLGNQTTTFLPKIRDDSFSEKNVRRDRIKSLKSKFSKLLNLSQYEQREAAPSMCQYSARKRGFSQIIRTHSKSKERLSQLDEVTRIKQKLTRNKIGVNMKALSQGLCLPDSQQHSTEPIENIFPNKELPSNPFMVETKKKKKKKK